MKFSMHVLFGILVGCASTAKAQREAVFHEFCETAKPILIDKRDKLVDTTEVQIRDHNKLGVALCGWGRK